MVRSAPVKSNHTDIGMYIDHKTQKKKRFFNRFDVWVRRFELPAS